MAIGAPIVTVGEQLRLRRRQAFVLNLQIAGFVVAVAALAWSTSPEPFSLAFLVLVLVLGGCLVRPVVGVYAAVGLSLVGDTVTSPWYPFTKNLSSRESILFVSDSLSFNPLELVLLTTAFAWLSGWLADPAWRFRRGTLLAPVLVFSGFVVFGMGNGLILRGGDTTAALLEARPLFYLPLLYVLITNLITTPRQYERLFFVALAGATLQSVFAISYFRGLDDERKENLESLVEHSATIAMSAILVYLIALLVLPGTSPLRRLLAAVAAIPVGWAWVLSQRRAAAIAVVAAMVLLSLVLLVRYRSRAIWFVPIAAVLGAGYTLAFWNSTGAAGFGAQAIKSVIAPGSTSAADQSSDLYRQIEAFDVWYSIRRRELTGLGFGHPFLQPIPLPEITFFPLAEYVPHNSVLWIYIKLGFFGFISMLVMMGRVIQRGAQGVAEAVSSDRVAVAYASLAYVVMYLVYAYVDIAWDVRSTVLLTVAFALCADMGRTGEPSDRTGVPAPSVVRVGAG